MTSRFFIPLVFCAGLLGGTAQAAELTILHMNDHHSHLRADGGLDLKLAGEKTRVRSGGFPAVVSTFKKLVAENENVLKLHAGDAITGDL
jgi:5'-nucleotidase/UDP-sugar diphosphatase